MNKIVILSLLLTLGLAACAEKRAPAPAATVQAVSVAGNLSGDVPTGARLWRERQCAACHGPNAAGGMGGALAKTPVAFENFLADTRNAPLPMPRLRESDLSDSDAYSIYLWLNTRSGPATPAAPASPAPLPTGQMLGIQIWNEKGCSECHGAFAQGSDKAPRLAGETYPFERQRAVMRLSADQNAKHAPENIPDDLFRRLLDWLRRGADPTSGC
ncbi:MAG: c-type cytochrome [Rudaea sp.]